MNEQMERKNKPAYIAYCKNGCGGIIFATVDVPERAEDVAADVAEIISDGYAIERVTVGFVHEHGFGCKCNQQLTLFKENTAPSAFGTSPILKEHQNGGGSSLEVRDAS